MPSLLVTNDFPPKHGGIQSYLYELWRRLPAEDTTVLTTALPEAEAWDARPAVPHRTRDGPRAVADTDGAPAHRRARA